MFFNQLVFYNLSYFLIFAMFLKYVLNLNFYSLIMKTILQKRNNNNILIKWFAKNQGYLLKMRNCNKWDTKKYSFYLQS